MKKNTSTQGKNHSCWESTAELLKIELCALQTEVTPWEPFEKNVANKINVSVHVGVMVCDVLNRESSSNGDENVRQARRWRASTLEVYTDRKEQAIVPASQGKGSGN